MNHRSFWSACLLALLGGVVQPTLAQTPEAAVRAVVDQLFDGMRAGDSTRVRATLHPQVRFLTLGERDGAPMLFEGSADGFVTAVGTPHDDVWDERIWDVEIRVDDRLATAWTPYAFFLGDAFSHCGVNAFQLANLGDGWQIIAITDTRHQEGCDLSKVE